MISKLRKMRTTEDEDDDSTSSTAFDTARPSWMVTLKGHAETWLKTLPASLSAPIMDDSPLSRYFGREVSTGKQLLGRIRKDLTELVEVCVGSVKQTNESRSLMTDLNQGMSSASLLIGC
jgi:dynein heavy chain 1